MQVPDIPHAAVVAEAIASDFYADRLDLSARDVVPGSTWSRMPEVECVTRLRVSGTSHRTVRLFLTFIAAMDRAWDATGLITPSLFSQVPEQSQRTCSVENLCTRGPKRDVTTWSGTCAISRFQIR